MKMDWLGYAFLCLSTIVITFDQAEGTYYYTYLEQLMASEWFVYIFCKQTSVWLFLV